MELMRFAVIDGYTLEELRREYQASDARGRVRLLKSLYKGRYGARPPYEIALMAVEDPNAEVREWMARHGQSLDYREPVYRRVADKGGEGCVPDTQGNNNQQPRSEVEVEYRFPERDLKERLANDPDPFVRACLRENPDVFRFRLVDHFREATHVERLALVRNPNAAVYGELIEKIFDLDDRELGLDLEARKQLALAYLTNPQVQSESRRGTFSFRFGDDWHDTRRHFSTLWRLASKWPPDTEVPYYVYRYVGADDATKAEIYQSCKFDSLRVAILENPAVRDFPGEKDTKTLELGMKDKDDECRRLADARLRGPQDEQDRRELEKLAERVAKVAREERAQEEREKLKSKEELRKKQLVFLLVFLVAAGYLTAKYKYILHVTDLGILLGLGVYIATKFVVEEIRQTRAAIVDAIDRRSLILETFVMPSVADRRSAISRLDSQLVGLDPYVRRNLVQEEDERLERLFGLDPDVISSSKSEHERNVEEHERKMEREKEERKRPREQAIG